MAYDEELADRLRELLAERSGVSEKKMFGGLAFMVDGHMTVCATGEGLMVRVDPEQSADLLADPRATPMVMQGRELRGWLRVALDPGAPESELRRWVAIGVDYAGTLPPKR